MSAGPQLGSIADDFTGATDLASALCRAGLRTVLLFGEQRTGSPLPPCDAVVVALKSRNLPPREAVGLSLAVQRWLEAQGVERTYFKVCSTFDSTDEGNIGVVADALLDAAGAAQTVVCPASPEHGRTVYQGHLFVGDELLSESPMREHPLTPMTDSSVVRLLQRQTSHPVGLVGHAAVRAGAEAVAAELARLRTRGVRFAVADAICDADLRTIASACRDLRVLVGAAGFGRALGELATSAVTADEGERPTLLPPGPGAVLAGSCSTATLRQVEHARARYPSLRLDPLALPDPDELLTTALAWIDEHESGAPFLIYASAQPKARSADAARSVERTLGALARHAVARGVRRVVVAGGETSGAVVDALGVESALVGVEEDPGVPWLLADGDPPLALLLKSGNFGHPDLFVRALERVA